VEIRKIFTYAFCKSGALHDLYYSEHGDEELKEEYCAMYMELMKLRESNQKKVIKLNTMKTERDTLLQKITDLEDKLMDAQLQLEKFSDNKIAQMLTGQKCSSNKTGLRYVATDSSNIASTSRTAFLKPSGSEPQNDKGKAIVVSCENDNITPAKSKHSIERSLPTCHHRGIVGHIRPNCGQLKFRRTWNEKNAPKKEKDVEEHSKTKYVPPHRRQLIQKFVLICHHCGLNGHIRPKCPHVLVQRSKVKKELSKKDSASTRPLRKHHAQRKLSRYALVYKTPICHQCGVHNHDRPRGAQPQKDPPRKTGPYTRYPAPRHQRQHQRFARVKQTWLPKKNKSQHHEEKPQKPKKDPSYEGLPIAGSFMRSLIRYMELQPKDGGQDRHTHFPRGSRPTE